MNRMLHRPSWPSAFFFSVALATLTPRITRAETSAIYKYQVYQEGEGRVRIEAQYAQLEQSIGTDAKLKIMGVIDAIAGATPTGEPPATPGGPVPTTHVSDRRKAWTADFSKQINRVNLTLEASNSRESDYVSNGVSINTLTDFNDKNTTLVAGVAGTDDNIKVFYQPQRTKKHSADFILGVNQLLDPKTSASFNLSWGRATGYMSDPYRIIEKNTELLPGLFLPLTFGENRPDQKNKFTVFTSINHAYDPLNAAVEGSYRYYSDSFGTHSHTLSTTWLQKIGSTLILAPSLRYYTQSAANFYHISLDGTSIVPGDVPNPKGPFFSSDYRLSKMDTLNLGLKLTWTPSQRLQFDLAYDRYTMKGRDGKTSQSAFPNANIVTAGVRFTW